MTKSIQVRVFILLCLGLCLALNCPGGRQTGFRSGISADDARTGDISLADGSALARLETKVDSLIKVQATLTARLGGVGDVHTGHLEGEQNVGALSGGGLYLTIVALSLVTLLATVLLAVIHRSGQWRRLFEKLSLSVEETDRACKSENQPASASCAVRAVKQKFKKKVEKDAKLDALADKSLVGQQLTSPTT